jgi:cytochrome d ubiquinol oxidase subunit I
MAVIFNPLLNWRLVEVTLGAALAAAFLMLGVTALQALRRPLDDGERHVFQTALVLAAIATVLQMPVALGAGKAVAQYQPAKAAALAGFWNSSAEPEWIWFAWPQESQRSNLGEIKMRNIGGMWLHRQADGVYQGLDKFSSTHPPVALTFWLLRLALGLGGLMLLVSWVTVLWSGRRVLDPLRLPSWWLRVLCGMMFVGGIAAVVGWWVSTIGLQPYAVNGTITQAEILSATSTSTLVASLMAYSVLYSVLLLGFLGMLFHAARYGVVPVRKFGEQV